MRLTLAAIAATAVFSVGPLQAEDVRSTPESHLVSPEAAQARLLRATDERQQNLATVDALFSSPQGTAALTSVGLEAASLSASLATLGNSELQDLAARAAALQTDPAAGAFSTNQILWIAGIALVVILLVSIL